MKDKLIVRKLELADDLAQVARLIYYTDDYVFPYLYDNDIKKAESVIVNMIQRNTIYHYRNITVATIEKKIVGIVVAKETPIHMDLGEMVRCFIDANQEIGERFTKTYNEYYKLFDNEPQGIYVANVCVDPLYRGQGIGKKMMETFLNAASDKTYHLESVKDNVAALSTYKALGFEIVNEYLGFTDVPCYRMIRRGN